MIRASTTRLHAFGLVLAVAAAVAAVALSLPSHATAAGQARCVVKRAYPTIVWLQCFAEGPSEKRAFAIASRRSSKVPCKAGYFGMIAPEAFRLAC